MPPNAETLYDRIGRRYSGTRREDPRIAAAIWQALGLALTVLNVGAGAGSYEPRDRHVVAVEPSEVMIAQRCAGTTPVVRASAERLPFEDDSFDAVMAVLSDHHWDDRTQGMAELRRVARQRVVLFTVDPAENARFWMTTEYLPEFVELIPAQYRVAGTWRRELAELLGGVTLIPVPIPHDCRDGFYGAFWRRPEAYLDADVRASISVFSQVPVDQAAHAIDRLRADLHSGDWRHATGSCSNAALSNSGTTSSWPTSSRSMQVSMARIVGINHVALEVGDVDDALAWYGRFFEFELRGRGPRMAFIDMGDQFIALAAGREQPPDEQRHIGLVVDDKEAVRAALDEAGVGVRPSGSLDFSDPWGNHVQVVDYRDVQFTKAPGVLNGMHLHGLHKSEAALEELRGKGLLD